MTKGLFSLHQVATYRILEKYIAQAQSAERHLPFPASRIRLFAVRTFLHPPKSEFIVYSALLHDSISGVSGFDFGIHRYVTVCNGTEPNVMVAFAPTKKATVMLL